MESSSEDSFLWTDASSNSRENIMTERKHKRNSGIKSESDDQLQEKDPNSDDTSYEQLHENAQVVPVKKETSNSEDRKNKRKIKSEPESEVDVPKKKKKAKRNDVSDAHHDSQSSVSYDNSYLDKKVKEEMSADREDPEVNSKAKKKKKKSKKKYISDDEHGDINVVDKFTAEETVVGYQEQGPETEANSASLNKEHNGTVGENDTFQEDSIGSCNEISAIKGDEDHNLHSRLFVHNDIENTEKSTDEENVDKLAEYNSRTPRISDRIRFEDEDELTQTSYTENRTDKPLSIKFSKVNRHLKTNTNLKPLTEHLNSSSIITKNDDIWLVKCPKHLDISAFKDINLKMEGKYKIKIGGQSYDSVAKEEESGRVTALSMENNLYQLKNLPLSGTINLKKRIPKPHFHKDNVIVNNQTNFIPLPETKCRHPLFGSDYKKALRIPSAIAERLNAENIVSDNSALNHSERKKKKKHKRDKSMDVDPVSHTEVTEEEPDMSTRIREKKRKRKIVVEDECPAPKKKRIKHDPESAEAWESEKAIEENLFNF